jgi:hypothetical protein
MVVFKRSNKVPQMYEYILLTKLLYFVILCAIRGIKNRSNCSKVSKECQCKLGETARYETIDISVDSINIILSTGQIHIVDQRKF